MFQLNMVKGDLQTELDDFFQLIDNTDFPCRVLTDSAFCQGRQKFSYQAFIELNDTFCDSFYQQSTSILQWHGMRLLAIDGSTGSLPACDPEQRLLKHFGKCNEHANKPSVRISELYDVINGISLDVQTSPFKGHGERQLALAHLQSGKTRPGDLVLLDRGYPAHWLFAQLKAQNLQFCARVQANASRLVERFIQSGQSEAIEQMQVDKDTQRRIDKSGADVTAAPITVRLVRVELSSNETEVLITSLLDTTQFPHDLFMDLYHQRWLVEEDYKKFKSRIEWENFTGLTVEAALQDIHAKVLSKNIVAVAVHEAELRLSEQPKKTKLAYQVNFSKALSKFKGYIVKLVNIAVDSSKLAILMITELMKNTSAVRPGRQNKRNKDDIKRRKGGFHMNYKRCK